MESVFQLLNHDNTISVNRGLAHALGLAESVIYAALLAKHAWYEKHDMLSDGWFYSTADDMEESTALSRWKQSQAIENLVKTGLVLCEKRGIPAKRYFYIVDDIRLLGSLLNYAEPSPARKAPASSGHDIEKLQNKYVGNLKTCFEENPHKTKVNKTKEIKPELIKQDCARAQIHHEGLSGKYGSGFADLAAEVTAAGIAGAFSVRTDGRTVSPEIVSSVFKSVDYYAVCHVADYIAGKDNIRDLRAYLRSALYTAALELAQKPKKAPCQRDYNAPLWDSPSTGSGSVSSLPDSRELLEDLRRQYADPPDEAQTVSAEPEYSAPEPTSSYKNYNEPLWDGVPAKSSKDYNAPLWDDTPARPSRDYSAPLW